MEGKEKDHLLHDLSDEKKLEVKKAIERQKLDPKTTKNTEFLKNKWVREAQKSWDIFYKQNQTAFFKDRHWLDREFDILQSRGASRKLLEVGCGVGNLVFPLAQSDPALNIFCCDFAPRAVELVKSNKLYDTFSIHAFQADITIPDILLENLGKNKMDIVTSIFCLSAIPPSKLNAALTNISSILAPGGSLILRDYAQGDGAQMRFKGNNVMELDESFYVRHDLTFSVFFTPEQLRVECINVGLEVVECGIVEKIVVNRKQALNMNRLFVQGVFRKI
jgi:methyltransferase-like protein 6